MESKFDLWEIEREYFAQGIQPICGVDEAGRGPLAGPVCAAAVILPPELEIPGLNDSKKLTDKKRPALALIDGNREKDFGLPIRTVVGGDARSANIAAASILAKVTRDDLMIELAKQYPAYGFDVHKGYGTKRHYEALRACGASPVHRQTFLRKFYGAG